MSLLTLAWKNLVNKPWSTALSIILFALGIGLVSLLFLIDNQLQDKFEKNLAGVDLVVGAKGSPLQLILSSMYHIDAPTGNVSIKEIKPFLNPKHPLIAEAVPLSLGDSYRTYRIVGTTHDFLGLYDAEIARGNIWRGNFEVTIGADVAQFAGLDLGDTFSSSHGFIDEDHLAHADAESFKVVGILEPTGSVIDQLILCTAQSYWLVHEHPDDHDHEGEEDHDHADGDHDHDHDEEADHDHAEGDAHDHDHEGAHADGEDHDHDDHAHAPRPLIEEDPERELTSILLRFKAKNYQALNMQRSINENTDMQAATPAIEINRLFSLMSAGEQALRILALVIVFVSGLSIFISLYSSLKDRKYELALMRVSGASRQQLFLLIIIEGMLLAMIGFVLGIVVSHLGMQLFAGAMQSSFRYNFSGFIFLREELYLLIGAVVIGVLAAVLPATQAARTDIADTLTGES